MDRESEFEDNDTLWIEVSSRRESDTGMRIFSKLSIDSYIGVADAVAVEYDDVRWCGVNWGIPNGHVALNSDLFQCNGGGRCSPAEVCWAPDHWVASSNPLGGKFRHSFRLIIPGVCLAQFSLNNVHKRGLKHHHFPSSMCLSTHVYSRSAVWIIGEKVFLFIFYFIQNVIIQGRWVENHKIKI